MPYCFGLLINPAQAINAEKGDTEMNVYCVKQFLKECLVQRNERRSRSTCCAIQRRKKKEKNGEVDVFAMIQILQINGIIHGASPLMIGPVVPSMGPQGETCGGYLRWTDKDKGGEDLAAGE
jgi:hypothetical protein